MLLKPDKLLSLTTSYRPISLISSIMKLFKRVIEQRLHSHLEQIGLINKHQSVFRRAKGPVIIYGMGWAGGYSEGGGGGAQRNQKT